jgi:hypothetical protein
MCITFFETPQKRKNKNYCMPLRLILRHVFIHGFSINWQYPFLKIVPTAKNWQHTAPKLKPMSQSEEFLFPQKWERIL